MATITVKDAGRLTSADLGKTVTAPWRGGDVTAPLLSYSVGFDRVYLELDQPGLIALALNPAARLTIKDTP